jgi:hypothetical protein
MNQLMAYLSKDNEFIEVNSVLSLLPIIRSYEGGSILFYATIYALLLNIVLAVRYRLEVFRWIGSLVWFITPVALNSAFNFSWEAEAFTIAYFVVAIGFLVARSIARGVMFISAKIPLAAYDRNKSLSYVVGYATSLFVLFATSLWAQNSQLYTTVALLVIMLLLHGIAVYIEKQRSIILLQPLLTQAFIVSFIRPDGTVTLINIYAVAATLAAAAWYWYVTDVMKDSDAQLHEYLRQIALGTTYIPAFASFSVGVAAVMPVSLAVAGITTLHFARSYTQVGREWAGAVIAISVMWFMQYLNVSELQAYTHVLAFLFAIYAYWRYVREEYDASTSYIWVTLAVATVPLALQALSTDSGGLYGWWLLLEQVFFLLVGLSINNKIITFWGLYVAIAAVLYQLRDLGWAALTILALTIIGIAIYQINKSGDNK